MIHRARNSRGSQVLRLASGAGIIFLFVLVETACSDDGITGESAASRAVKARADTVRGSVTLSWTPPTQNTDGSKLSDLAGYKIYYGTSEKYFQRVIEVKGPGVNEYTINNLPPFRYYFAVTAYNVAGAESTHSNVQSKTVR
ncbi:MAG: fibronectin type III domain-containing protein [Acidiferrobacterales bacterium]